MYEYQHMLVCTKFLAASAAGPNAYAVTAIPPVTAAAINAQIMDFLLIPIPLPISSLPVMLATQSFDGNSVLGNVSLVYQFGFWTGAIIPIGFAISLLLTGFLYGKKLNKMKLLTLPDFYYRRYGKSAESISSIILIVNFLVLIAGDLAATGYILSTVLDIDFFWSVLIAAIIVLLYSFSGGIFSSAYADIIFVFLAIVALWAAFIFISIFVGGNGNFIDGAPAVVPKNLDLTEFTNLASGPDILYRKLLQRKMKNWAISIMIILFGCSYGCYPATDID